MNLNLDIGQWIVIGLSAFLFIWYVFAGAANRKTGIATYRFLRAVIGEFGDISGAEWIGSSNMGARIQVKKANKPIQRIEARYLLEPREFLPYWLVNYLRGKHDEILIRISLSHVPPGNLEIRRISHKAKNNINQGQLPQDFQMEPPEYQNSDMVEKIASFLEEYGQTVEKILLQRKTPHVELQARVKPLLNVNTEAYSEALLSWLKVT
jgi:hypothetical protein